jgi:hypothetical protein
VKNSWNGNTIILLRGIWKMAIAFPYNEFIELTPMTLKPKNIKGC